MQIQESFRRSKVVKQNEVVGEVVPAFFKVDAVVLEGCIQIVSCEGTLSRECKTA